jgi:hypothetical protein
MKLLTLLLVVAHLTTGLAHGPGGDEDDKPKGMEPPKVVAPAKETALGAPNTIPSSPAAPPKAAEAPKSPKGPRAVTFTPNGCRKIATDSDWPTPDQWRAALPEVEPSMKKNGSHPDYVLRAETVNDVQQAVKFCAKNNIRLTVINSGHDFMGRNDAPSGLSLDVSLLTGIRVLEEFNPTAAGAEKPLKAVNTIVPVAGKQAAVTFGVAVSSQRLHNAVNPSKLVTIGAAHGKTVLVIGRSC